MNDDERESACDVALNDKSQSWSGEVVAASDDEADFEHENGHIENCCEEFEDVIE